MVRVSTLKLHAVRRTSAMTGVDEGVYWRHESSRVS